MAEVRNITVTFITNSDTPHEDVAYALEAASGICMTYDLDWELGIPQTLRHAIAEVVNYDYDAEEADYVQSGEPEGHVFEHLKRLSDWLKELPRESH